MFVSTDFLAIHYGVDDTIAKFFVDREPPANNLYWHKKLLYLRFEPGFLFLPLIADLFYKAGVSRSQILSEEFIQLMEAIGHISALEETKKITQREAVEQCHELAAKVCLDPEYLTSLGAYFNNDPGNLFQEFTTGFNALHRGDLFLYSICALSVKPGYYQHLVRVWFALISSLLLQDDAEDIDADKKNNDENAFLESGLDSAGMDKITLLVKNNLQYISTLNKTMAAKLDKQMVEMFNKPFFQQHYNQH